MRCLGCRRPTATNISSGLRYSWAMSLGDDITPYGLELPLTLRLQQRGSGEPQGRWQSRKVPTSWLQKSINTLSLYFIIIMMILSYSTPYWCWCNISPSKAGIASMSSSFALYVTAELEVKNWPKPGLSTCITRPAQFLLSSEPSMSSPTSRIDV